MVVFQNPSGSYTAVIQPTPNSGTILKVNGGEPIFQEGIYSFGNWHDNAGDSVAFGLMQAYKDFPTYAGKAWIFRGLRNFANVNWKSDVFLNIGAGVGELFMKAQEMGILDKGFGLGDWARVTANYFGSGQDTWWYTAFVFGKYFWRLKGKQAIGFYSFDNLLDTALGALGTNRAKTYEHLKRFCREHPPLTEKDAIEGWKTLVDRSW